MPAFTMASFAAEAGRLAKDLELEARGQIAFDMAKGGQKIARRAVQSDLGALKFRNWDPRLATKVKKIRGGAILVPTRSSAGPWTVAERGRNQGGASGFHGPGINRRTGVTSRTKSGGLRKVRATKGRRWNGRTRGMDTASEARQTMERELPKIAEKGARRVTMKHFDVT